MPPSVHATLTLIDLDAGVADRLRARAARNRRSVEAEAREILTAALAPSTPEASDLAEAIRGRFAPIGGVDLEPHPPVSIGTPLLLDP